MEVTTRLTWNDEKRLQKQLGNVSLSLLYKSSVHGFGLRDMVQRCSHQGSTVTMIYLKTNIIGVFMLGNYPTLSKYFEEPHYSFCFLFRSKDNITGTDTFLLNMAPEIADNQLMYRLSDETIFSLCPNNKTLYLLRSVKKKLGLFEGRTMDPFIYGECEVFRVEGVKGGLSSIKRIMNVTQHRDRLLEELRAYKPYADLVSKVHILLLGPVGSGKSSFFNSVKSVFHGRMTRQALVGSDITSITEQYRTYSVKDGIGGKSLPFMLCDSMGLDETEKIGLCMDDIPHILKGCMPDRYQFNPHKPITPQHSAFITSPSLKDRIHCVAYVLDINSINSLSSKMVAKFKQVHKEVLNCGIAHVALLTKVKNYNEVLQGNFLNMNRSMTSQSQVMKVSKMLDIPIRNILMVENYASEFELDPVKDVLILSALKQILRAADDILEDLPLAETGKLVPFCPS
ncbi:interferon-induced protein 44-like isoform X1 [Lemur catta]|uniref:interferon-induced protein 44-like isoform X1 n=1 Tax=Lemur catta TaxID=9447 RepID=UPI001E26CE06|nr:interferon-induced protein 44-like isoform X1 [Lemur catta]